MKKIRLIFLSLLFSLSFSKAQSVPPGSDFVSFDCGIQQDKERLGKKFFASTPAIFLRVNNDEFTYGTLQLGKRKKQIFMYLQIMADNVCIKKDRNVDIYFESGEIISLQNEYPLNCDGFFVRQLKKNELEKLKNNKITLIKIYTYNKDYEFYMSDVDNHTIENQIDCLSSYEIKKSDEVKINKRKTP